MEPENKNPGKGTYSKTNPSADRNNIQRLSGAQLGFLVFLVVLGRGTSKKRAMPLGAEHIARQHPN